MEQYQQDWDAKKTWIFAVGILEWENSEVFPSFLDAIPGRFDEKLVNFFRSRGVPDEQIIYLQDRSATLDQIQQNFPEFLSNSSEDDLLILYFAGHGDWDSDSNEHYFVNYDANALNRDNYWSLSSIFEDIDSNFNGSKALILADCCYSGGLIDQAKMRDSAISYACVSSAYSHNTSTGSWTFTESLYKGLLGDPVVDQDGDRTVTLYDFARYAELEMAFIEEQKSMFVTTKDFDPQMQLARVSDDIEPVEDKRVMVEYEGEWYKAKTLERNNAQVKVQYIEDQSEEWVENERICPYNPEMFAVGEEVEVECDEEWYPAKVKKAWFGLHFISYDDYPDCWMEWVGSDRIRLR